MRTAAATCSTRQAISELPTVQCQAGGKAATAIEPLGDNGVDRAAPHGDPARRHDQDSDIKLPGVADEGEADHAQRHQPDAQQNDGSRPAALDRVAHLKDQNRADQIIKSDRRRDRGGRPAVNFG
jgi:hypothetical protein